MNFLKNLQRDSLTNIPEASTVAMFEATPEKVFDSVEILERIAGGILKGIVSEAIPEVSLDELLKKNLEKLWSFNQNFSRNFWTNTKE